MIKQFFKGAAALSLIATSFFSTADADTQEMLWGNIALPGYYEPTDIGSCLVSRIGVGGLTASVQYKGYNFDEMVNTGASTRTCRDDNNHTIPIHQICRVTYDNGTVVDNHAGYCPPETCETCSTQPGNSGDKSGGGVGANSETSTPFPTSLPSLSKMERSVDWVSPKDPRFQFSRYYRSDQQLVMHFLTHNVRDGFAGVWRSNFNEVIRLGTVGLSDGHYILTNNEGRSTFFDQTSFAPSRAGHSLTMAASGNDLVVGNGSGMQKFFTEDADGIYMLSQTIWGDGYSLTFERGTDSRLVAVEDNRGQRAELTWTPNVVPNLAEPLISGIEVDTNYDGANFAPDVEVTYSYLENPYVEYRPAVETVTLADISNNTSETQFFYTYGVDRFSYPPKLFRVFDGRQDATGADIHYKNIWYHVADNWVDEVKGSELNGGAGRNTFSRESNGDIKVVKPLGKEVLYDFDGRAADGRLQSITNVAGPNSPGTVVSYSYGADTLQSERIARNGAKTTYVRDSRGFVLTRTEDADGVNSRVTNTTWDSVLRKPLSRETTHLREDFTYDVDGLTTSYTQTDVLLGSPSLGHVRSWTYTYTTLASGLKVLSSMDGPGDPSLVNDVTNYTYNADGTVASMTDPNGLVTTYSAYNPAGQVTAMSAPDGIDWAFTYDIEGRMLSTTRNPASTSPSTTNYVYDEAGLLVSQTDSIDRTWSFEYDGARRMIKATNPSGEYASYEYDRANNVTRSSQHESIGAETFFQTSEFDELGRLMRSSSAETFEYNYDLEDNLTQVTDAFGLAKTQLYDALNRVVSAVDEDGSTTLFEHDRNNQVTRYTDPRAIDTLSTFNGFGEMITEVSADRGTMTYAYNARGLVTTMTDGRGVVTNYEYDDGGRITAKRVPSDSTLDQVFTYGTNGATSGGKLAFVTEGSGATSLTHDPDTGLPATKSQTIESASYLTSMGYDLEGQRTSMTYPSGGIAQYTYDGDGRITGVTYATGEIDPQTGQPVPPVSVATNAEYLPNGPRTGVQFGDGFTLNETFDTTYQLLQQIDGLSGSSLREVGYEWTARGNLSKVTDALNPANDQLLRYSLDQRLAQAAGAWGGFTFDYDHVGNRISKSSGVVQQASGGGATSGESGDPYWSSVSYLSGFETDYNDESTAGLIPYLYEPEDPLDLTQQAAQIGATGLAVNADGQKVARMSLGKPDGLNFGTGDFTIEGLAQSTFNNSYWRGLLGDYWNQRSNTWGVFLGPNPNNTVRFGVRGQPFLYGTSDQGLNAFHFAVSRNGDTVRLFVNGVMEAKSAGWANVSIGAPDISTMVGSTQQWSNEYWRGYLDELRITKGVGRYSSDVNFSVPTEEYPRDTSDPHWSSVSYLSGFETDYNDESTAGLVPYLYEPEDPLDLTQQAAQIGATGLAVNADGQNTSRMSLGKPDGLNFGTGDFTIEGFAQSTLPVTNWRGLLGDYWYPSNGTWGVFMGPNPTSSVRFGVRGQPFLYGTSNQGLNPFHFAVSRNGDTVRLFVNGVMEAKSTGWANVSVGDPNVSTLVGSAQQSPIEYWSGYLDELRMTKGVGRYNSDTTFSVPTEAYPRTDVLGSSPTTGAVAVSQHVPSATANGTTTETANVALGAEYADRHLLLNVGWAAAANAEITGVTVGGVPATRLHRINGAATENAELWAVALPTGTTGDVTVTWDNAVTHRHLTLLSAPLDTFASAYVGTAAPDGNGGYSLSGLAIPSGGMLVGGTLGAAINSTETTLFAPSNFFNWNATNQATSTNGVQLQTHVFSAKNDLTTTTTHNASGPAPFYVVAFDRGDFLDPTTVETDTYTYGANDNRLLSISEATGHTRTFTHDAAGNTTFDDRSGGGYGYTYDALGRMDSLSINGVVQAEYEYNALGQQVVRRLTQTGETIHNVFDLDGNRIAEYLYDAGTGSSTLIREYIWMNGAPVGVVEGGQVFFVRTDHIGRPVFATNDLGVKVWEASYLPFGGVHTSTGAIDLRFPGQWFQAESGLHQNWMRDYDPTTGRYIQADPLGLVDGASVYGYALQNPGRYVDPRGESIFDTWDELCNLFPHLCTNPRKPGQCAEEDNCYEAYLLNIEICKMTSPGKSAKARRTRQRCYETAAETLADCYLEQKRGFESQLPPPVIIPRLPGRGGGGRFAPHRVPELTPIPM